MEADAMTPEQSFNPRSLHRERRREPARVRDCIRVSIHAPYIGSDATCNAYRRARESFNPRSLHRERLDDTRQVCSRTCFNPRSLHRERRYIFICWYTTTSFNPCSLHRERRTARTREGWGNGFNPRSLHRERRDGSYVGNSSSQFQSTLPT